MRPSTGSRVPGSSVRRIAVITAVLAVSWLAAQAGPALVVHEETGPPDAILMLASHEWERLPAAAALARSYPASRVVITTPPVVTIHNCHLCGERVDWLVHEGVPRDRIQILPGPSNTYEEALAARRHASEEPFTRLAVVTSPYHTRRVLATFEEVFAGTGIEIDVVPAAPAQGTPERWWLDAFDRHYVRYEWAAILKYWWDYGVPVRSR
jgi:uncharacterized SAM-binding protein YcdF (DUF218 family)